MQSQWLNCIGMQMRTLVFLEKHVNRIAPTLPMNPEPPVMKIVLPLYSSCIGVNWSGLPILIDNLQRNKKTL